MAAIQTTVSSLTNPSRGKLDRKRQMPALRTIPGQERAALSQLGVRTAAVSEISRSQANFHRMRISSNELAFHNSCGWSSTQPRPVRGAFPEIVAKFAKRGIIRAGNSESHRELNRQV